MKKELLMIEHEIASKVGQTVYVTDAGHGWFMVPYAEIMKLGIAEKVSTYSYLDNEGKFAFLEEDCDAGLYIKARQERGVDTFLREFYDGLESCVRDMRPFTFANAVRAGLID